MNKSLKKEGEQRMIFFRQKCREYSLRCTPQKEKIYQVLAFTNSHPNAQEIFNEVKTFFPNISFATVYKNILMFTAKGMIQELNFGEKFSRYDAHIEPHHHIFNTQTQNIADIEIDLSALTLPKELEGVDIKKVSLSYFI